MASIPVPVRRMVLAAFLSTIVWINQAPLLAQAPGLTGRKLSFSRDIHPLLSERCGTCHSASAKQGGLSVMTVVDLLKGGASGPAVVAGKSGEGQLLARITGEKKPVMPMGGAPLAEKEIAVIREWIDSGAASDAPSNETSWVAPLKPRLPEPPAKGHPIDAFVSAYWAKKGAAAPARVSDELFLRRVSFDLHGLPPSSGQSRSFLSSPSPNKRVELIDSLLADREPYANHFISFWNDLLHNDEGVVYHGERKSISTWLLGALRENMPYDRFVATLLNPAGPNGPEGFVMGVNWRGDISASQTPAMQAAQNSAQVFMGVNIKCASCHDSFINQWKLKDSYGLASFFSDEPLELVRCDVKTGEKAATKFLYPELGDIKQEATVAEKRAAAAAFFTNKENGRLARTFVNRMWERLFGRGLVATSDDMDSQPWDADLLDFMAADFAGHAYDVQHLLRQILTSQAYQSVSVAPPAEGDKPEAYVFRGPVPRRLQAEQFADAISALTGQWRSTSPRKAEPSEYVRDWRLKATPLSRSLGRPVRDLAVTDRADDPSTLQALELVNGSTLAAMVERGGKYFASGWKVPPKPLFDSGVLTDKTAEVDVDLTGVRSMFLLIVDGGTYDPARTVAGWADATLEGSAGSTTLGELLKRKAEPLKLSKDADGAPALLGSFGNLVPVPLNGGPWQRFRAKAGVDRASLGSDISPNVRFLVYSNKPDPWQLLSVAGDSPIPKPEVPGTPAQLVDWLFSTGYGRLPSPAERKIAIGIVTGGKASTTPAGASDLLWAMVLSPEFQYIF